MRVVIQRVKFSQVEVAGLVVGKIGQGLNLLVGIADTDTEAELDWMARKCLELRLFPDQESETGRWEKSVQSLKVPDSHAFLLYGLSTQRKLDKSIQNNPELT